MAQPYTPESLLTATMSAETETRKAAEEYIQTQSTQNPSLIFQYLLEGMKHPLPRSKMALYLIKTYFLGETDSIPQEFKEAFSNNLLEIITTSTHAPSLLTCADILARFFIYNNRQQELLGKLVGWSEDANPQLRIFSMTAFERLAEVHLESKFILAECNSFMQVFAKTLQDPDLNVKIASLKATAIFLCSIDDEELVMKFQEAVGVMVQILIEALKHSEEDGRVAMDSLITLTQTQPDIWMKNISQVVVVCSEIAANQAFENSTRTSAIDIVLTVCNENPGKMRKVAEMKAAFFPVLMNMLTEVENREDLVAWNKDEEDEVSKNDPYTTALDSISRMSLSLSGQAMLVISEAIITTFIHHADWRFKQAALMCLGMMAQGSKEAFKKKGTIDGIIKLMLPLFDDPHVRVRYAGVTALALFATELKPKFGKNYHELYMTKSVAAMDDPSIRMQTQGCSSITNFCRGILENEEGEKMFNKYAEVILKKVGGLLQRGIIENYMPLQAEVLSCISVVATTIDKDFVPYYHDFMPGLKNILANTPMDTPRHKELRANTISAIGYMMSAVADQKEEFLADAKEIMTGLITLHGMNLPPEDPQTTAIMNVYPFFGTFFKEDFAPYLTILYPKLTELAKKSLDMKIQDLDNPALKMDAEDLGLNIKGLNLSVNTIDLQGKIQSMKILSNLSEVMGKGFFPFTEPTAALFKDYINYTKSRPIKKSACAGFKGLLMSCSTEDQMQNIFSYLYPCFRDAFKHSIEVKSYKDQKIEFKAFFLGIKLLRNPPLSDAQLEELVVLMGQSVMLYLDYMDVQTEQLSKGLQEDLNEDDVAIMEENLIQMGKLIGNVMDIAGHLSKSFGSKIAPLFQAHLIESYMRIWEHKNATSQDRLQSICFFCDTCEYLGAEVCQLLTPKVAVKFLGELGDEEMGVVQSAIYGLGVLAQFGGSTFVPFKTQTITV